jgi:flagellar biosynthesis protein FliQ
MNQNRNISKKENPESICIKVKNQWKIFLGIFAAPLIIIPLIACVLSIYFATYQVTEQPFSLVLNIIAALLAGVASGGIWDSVKNMMGNTLLIKKGDSAVRNLSLARVKVKNISERTKVKATSEEIMNLLGLLEKDIANSLQEWNDILPGVANIEVVYGLLDEREKELIIAIQEKEDLNNRLAEEKEFQDGEKEKLQKDLENMKKRVLDLNQEISRLKTQVVITSGYSGSTGPMPRELSGLMELLGSKCSKCGKAYVPINALTDKGLCNDCNK